MSEQEKEALERAKRVLAHLTNERLDEQLQELVESGFIDAHGQPVFDDARNSKPVPNTNGKHLGNPNNT